MTETERPVELRETAEPPAAEASAPAGHKQKRKRKRKWKKWPLLLLALVLLAMGARRLRGGFGFRPGTEGMAYALVQPERRNIVRTLSGAGALNPANSYTVTTLVEGEVLSAGFEEGDMVEKGAVLYQVDSANAANSIEQARRSLEQAEISRDQAQRSLASSQRSYTDAVNHQYVRSPVVGRVVALSVQPGDSVSAGQTIATVRDSDVMRLTVPFPADDAMGFYVGQGAEVTLDGSFELLYGVISEVAGVDAVGNGNMILRDVTVEVYNPGALNDSQAATVRVGEVGCAASGVFTYRAEGTVAATTSGTVLEILAGLGDAVDRDQAILSLGGTAADSVQSAADSVQNAAGSLRNAELSLESAQLSLENSQEQLENYTVTSPISGTIVEKYYKTGDTIEAGRQLCTIYDLSYLELTLYVDELDINSVSVGQEAVVTADAVEGRSYNGRVTRVSVAGTTSGGVTSYPVTVRIDATDGLLPGMNADVELILDRRTGALSLPNAAVGRGNVVLVTVDSPSAARGTGTEAPEGYVQVQVSPGISDDDYVEILDGLVPGDTVAYIAPHAENLNSMQQMMELRAEAMGREG